MMILDFVKENIIDLITAVAAIFSLYFAFKASRLTNYINTITVERIKWLSSLKELSSEFVACCYSLDLPNKVEYTRLVKLHKIMLLYLNPKEDEKIIKILNELIVMTSNAVNELNNTNKSTEFLKLTEKADDLIINIQAKCKIEWERIKKEAGKQDKNTNYSRMSNEIENLTLEYREIYKRTY